MKKVSRKRRKSHVETPRRYEVKGQNEVPIPLSFDLIIINSKF